MASLNLLVTLLVVWAAHLMSAVSSRVLDYPSEEDGSYQPPSDDSNSGWRGEDSRSIDDEDDNTSLELNNDAMDDGITSLDSSPEEKPVKRNSSLLVDVYKKADLYSDAAVKFASIAEQKINDLSQRIFNIRNMIVGPPGQPGQNDYQNNDPNGNNGNDWDTNDGYGNRNFRSGGGGGSYNNGGLRGSLVASYNTIWPLVQAIGTWLNKLLQISTKIASKHFFKPPVQSREIQYEGRKSKFEQKKAGKQYQTRGKSFAPAGPEERVRGRVVANGQNRGMNDQRFYN